MVSPTRHTETVRKNKKVKMGRKRKNKLANKGSTLSQAQLFGLEDDLSQKKKK